MSDEVEELRAVARDVARDPQTGWKQWAELGWLSLLVAEERGGAGADERAAAVVARELGAAARREPFVGAGVFTTALLAALPPSAEVDGLLGSVMSGELLVVPAWQPESGALPGAGPGAPAGPPPGAGGQDRLAGPPSPEPGAPGDPAHELQDAHALRVSLPVTLTGGTASEPASVLTGTAHWLPVAEADVWLVAARTAAATGLVRVERDAPGLTVHPVRAADGTAQAHLELDRTPGTVLTDDATRALSRAIDTAALITAAELLGGIDTMVELTRGYLIERRQFGRAIGTFQALQHRTVDMWVQQQLAEAALDGALRRVTAATGPASADDPAARAIAASSAKSRASSAALKVANDAVQLHGAIGFTDEYALGAYVNRAFVLAASLGNARAHISRHGRLVA